VLIENSSSSEKNRDDFNPSLNGEEQSSDSDLNVADSNLESFNEKDDSEQGGEKEIVADARSLKKNLSKD